jgi:hypothetical protein
MYFLPLENAYIWQDANDLSRKPMKLRLFHIVNALPVTITFAKPGVAYPAPEINLCGGDK